MSFTDHDLANSPNWSWMPGMLWRVERDAPLENILGRVPDQHRDAKAPPYPGAVPVITDPATKGCMLELARELWGDPDLHVRRGVYCDGYVGILSTSTRVFYGRSEAEILRSIIIETPVVVYGGAP